MNTDRKIENFFDGSYTVNFYQDREKVDLVCDRCGNYHTYTMRSIRRFLQTQEMPTCRSMYCRPKVPEGFDLVSIHLTGIPKIACKSCNLEYYNHKFSKKYTCYCQLKTKFDEHQLYSLFKQSGDSTILREVYFKQELSSHKCDLAVFTGGRSIFIELDGREHYGSWKDIEFNNLFYYNRADNDHLVRIRQNISLEDREKLVREIVDNTIELPPVSYQRHSVNGELVFQEYAPVIAYLPEAEIIDAGQNIEDPQEVENNP